jgi:DNA-directed RNA polymerase omega subunit
MAQETDLIDEQQDGNVEPPDIDSKYRMIILAAQRSKQLQRGALPRVDADPRKTKPTRIAMREFQEKKVNFKILEQDKKGRQ